MAIKKNKKFSAFKLFYDEFIYKDNNDVSYANVEKNIKKIYELTMEIRKMSKIDLEFYRIKLQRANKRIKEQLDEMYNANKALFEYYFLKYKTYVEMCTDKVDDMPFIVSCSFYDDYRLDNKSVEKLESSSYVVPKYTSLEKKEIRNKAKGLTKFEFFCSLIKDSENANLYSKYIEKSDYLLSIKPYINESHNTFFDRIKNDINRYYSFINGLEEICKTSIDYELISDYMQIAFRKKFNNWNEDLKEIIDLHFDDIYNRMKSDESLRGQFNVGNDISYESFNSLVDELVLEKEKLFNEFESGVLIKVSLADNSYVSKFKENLINSFFDKRYKNSLKDSDGNSSVDDYVNRAIELYSLAFDLESQIFERMLFEASHSPSLKRNSDVRSAIIRKIYDLYNPRYLLSFFEAAKNEFMGLIEKKDDLFKRKFDSLLNQKKNKYNYHGPIPSVKNIKARIVGRQLKFIEDYCITELKSRDSLDNYDTRNYDLSVMTKGAEISDLVELYDNMKVKIINYNFESLCYYDSHEIQEKYEKEQLLISAQRLVAKAILHILKLENLVGEELDDKYRDICYGYFNEKCLFIKEGKQSSGDYNDFLRQRKIFNERSKWTKLLAYNKIRSNIM